MEQSCHAQIPHSYSNPTPRRSIALAVRKNGPMFEQWLLKMRKQSPGYGFLFPGKPGHKYYQAPQPTPF